MKKLTQKQLESLKLGRRKGLKKPGAGFKIGHKPWNKEVKGIHLNPATEFKKGELHGIQFKKGQIPWNKGLTYSQNIFLKEDKNAYKALHKRIGRKFIKTGMCNFCQTVGQTEWANKENKYLEIREDWLELCRKCHVYYDRI